MTAYFGAAYASRFNSGFSQFGLNNLSEGNTSEVGRLRSADRLRGVKHMRSVPSVMSNMSYSGELPLVAINTAGGENYDPNIDGISKAMAGLVLTTTSKVFFDPKAGTWTGKNFKTYSNKFNGNGATGGKKKFASKTSTGFKVAGWGLGIYNSYAIIDTKAQGLISDFQMGTEQISNGINTFGGIHGAA